MTNDRRTQASFGFEWSRFHDVFPEYEANFLSYVAPLERDFFAGKTVMDAGCGAGRHAWFAHQFGAREVLAFDFSAGAVEAASANLRGLAGVSVHRADIYALPVEWRDRFDCAMCIGVLHHLPDPQAGFEQLVRCVRPGGILIVWVYGTLDNRLARWVYEPMRGVTTRLPHKVLYHLSLLPALAVELCNRARIPLFRQYAGFPFRTKWNDAFDVLSAPRARYYGVADILRWFAQAGLRDIRVHPRRLCGKAK